MPMSCMYRDDLVKEFTELDLKLLEKVQEIILQIVQAGIDKGLPAGSFSCHSLARFVAKKIPEVVCKDGSYLGLRKEEGGEKLRLVLVEAPHSWLVTPDGAIIDPYPVGITSVCGDVAVKLAVTKGPFASYSGNMYLEGPVPNGLPPDLEEQVEALQRLIE